MSKKTDSAPNRQSAPLLQARAGRSRYPQVLIINEKWPLQKGIVSRFMRWESFPVWLLAQVQENDSSLKYHAKVSGRN